MRSLAVGIALGLVMLAAPSAGAQRAVTAGIEGVSDQQVVQGTIPLEAQGSATAGIRRVTMWIDGDVVAEVTPNNLRQQAEATFQWDTTRYVTSDQIARNRTYQIRVKAVSNSGAEDEVTRSVIVDNAPSSPTGLTADVDGNSITLRWEANPEPDITGYRVERYYGNEYEGVAIVRSLDFKERKDPGQYQYRVLAIRASEVDPEGILSAPSAPATGTIPRSAGSGLEDSARGRSGSGVGGRGGKGGSSVRIGRGGLPSGAALPRLPGLSGLPDAPEAIPWGSYEKRLPYKLPKGGIPIEAAPARSEGGEWIVIPPDGLRWVALGLLLMVAAGFSRFVAWRLQAPPAAANIDG